MLHDDWAIDGHQNIGRIDRGRRCGDGLAAQAATQIGCHQARTVNRETQHAAGTQELPWPPG